MADYGRNGTQQANGSPYVTYGKGTEQNASTAHINQGFSGSQSKLNGQQEANKSASQATTAKAGGTQSSSSLTAVIVGVVVTLVILGVAGAVIGVVVAGQRDNGNTNSLSKPTEDTTSTVLTLLTSNPEPHSTSKNQQQTTVGSPEPDATTLQQQKTTEEPNQQTTINPQPNPTTAHQQTTTAAHTTAQPTTAAHTTAQPTTAAHTTAQPIEGDIFNTKICGTQPAVSNRILGGTNAEIGHWPWIGSLQTDATDDHSCGATLLNNGWAVTATHCFDNAVDPDKITFGFVSLPDPGPHAQSSAFTPFHHNLYNAASSNSEYDITLLKLHANIVFNEYVRPICLSTLVEETQKYTNCQAAGWGALVDPDTASSDYPEILQELDLPLISSADCKVMDSGATDNIICAGASAQGGMDTCQGDSGGPLICTNNQDESWHLVGVVSTGSGCGRPNTPAFYTRITRFLDWIQTTINANS